MDADRLRLILLLAGMVLVVAIYLWDRYKRSRTRLKGLSLRQARRLQRELADQEPVENDEIISFSAVEKEPPVGLDKDVSEDLEVQPSFLPDAAEEVSTPDVPDLTLDVPKSQ